MHHWNYENNATKQGTSGPTTFEFVDEILKCDHLMKATEQYFPVVLFIMLYTVV